MKCDMEIDLWYNGSMPKDQKDNQECRCCRVCKFRSWVPCIYINIWKCLPDIRSSSKEKQRYYRPYGRSYTSIGCTWYLDHVSANLWITKFPYIDSWHELSKPRVTFPFEWSSIMIHARIINRRVVINYWSVPEDPWWFWTALARTCMEMYRTYLRRLMAHGMVGSGYNLCRFLWEIIM